MGELVSRQPTLLCELVQVRITNPGASCVRGAGEGEHAGRRAEGDFLFRRYDGPSGG